MSRRYVILVADGAFLGNPHDQNDPDAHGLRQNLQWADQLDASDGQMTPPDGPTRGDLNQRVLVVRMRPPREASVEAMLASTLESYRDAARWAGARGAIGILVGHGDAGTESATAWADLAPRGNLRVTLEELLRIRARRSEPLTPQQNTVVEIGAVLRRARIARVDLLTCNTGYGSLGQRFLDELHAVWQGVRVRGLRGYLTSGWNGATVGAWVEAPTHGGAGQAPSPPNPANVYYDRIPDDSEWTSSRGR